MSIKSGIILLNKPIGISSNTAVNKVKYLVKADKAGHLGTLDVLGDGVLPITLNKATRLFDFFLTKDKTYRACFVFGFETDTLDCEGKVTSIGYRQISREEVQKILNKFTGKTKQMPPQYSALKIDGKTAYDIARKGGVADIKSREVEIFDLKLLEEISQDKKKELLERFNQFNIDKLHIDCDQNPEMFDCFQNNTFEFEITCSAGTYIRSLCRDIAKELSICGTMLCITRTRCGVFDMKNAKSLEDIKNGYFDVVDVESIIDLPAVYLEKSLYKDLVDGKKVFYVPVLKGKFKLYCDNVFFGIANNTENGRIKIETYLKENT